MSHIHRHGQRCPRPGVFASTLLGPACVGAGGVCGEVEDSGGSLPPLPTGKDPTLHLAHTVVAGGMPGWDLAVIVAARLCSLG